MNYVPFNPDLDLDQSSEPIRDYPTDKSQFKLSVFPTSITFAEQKVNTESTPIPLVLMNSGYDLLTIEDIKVVGDFELVGDLPEFINPGAALGIQVRATPKHNGAFSGGVYIDTGDAAGSEFIQLFGVGVASSTSDFLTQIIRATNEGLGTANAIQAVTDVLVPTGNGKAIIALPIAVNNTGVTTVQFNNNAPVTVKEADGSDLEASDLVAGTVVLGYMLNNTFKLLTDNTLATALALLTQHRDDAEAFANDAEEARNEIIEELGQIIKTTVAVTMEEITSNSTGNNFVVSVPGVVLGDTFVGASFDVDSLGLVLDGYVNDANEVTLIPTNTSGDDIDLEEVNINICVMKA